MSIDKEPMFVFRQILNQDWYKNKRARIFSTIMMLAHSTDTYSKVFDDNKLWKVTNGQIITTYDKLLRDCAVKNKEDLISTLKYLKLNGVIDYIVTGDYENHLDIKIITPYISFKEPIEIKE